MGAQVLARVADDAQAVGHRVEVDAEVGAGQRGERVGGVGSVSGQARLVGGGAGDRVVSSRALFGSCFVILDEILPRWGVETVFVDGADLDQWREALSVPTTAVFFETPSNPMQELVDIAAVSELAHAAGATVVVDNVFGTPVFSHPLDFGADVVVYSATKHIDGQGRALGGAILGTAEFIGGPVKNLMRHTGPSLSPGDCTRTVIRSCCPSTRESCTAKVTPSASRPA